MISVIGWCDAWGSPYAQSNFTDEKKQALISRIKKRLYNFNYTDHQTLPFCCPLYNDQTICILSKKQWDEVMAEAYSNTPRGARLLPQDVLTNTSIKGALFEKQAYISKN